jgi:hypothetical protein
LSCCIASLKKWNLENRGRINNLLCLQLPLIRE